MHSQIPHHRILFSLRSILSSTLKPIHLRPFSSSWLSQPGNPLINWPSLPSKPTPTPNPISKPESPAPNFSPNHFTIISTLFTNPSLSPGSSLHTNLTQTGIKPTPPLLRAVFDHFASSPKLLHSLYLWALNQPGFKPDSSLFDSVINALAKMKEFDDAWSLVLDDDDEKLVSVGTFAILIRRYARAGTTNVFNFTNFYC